MAHARWAIASRSEAFAIASLSKLVGVDPYFEEAHVTLIEALEILEEPQAAARAYDLYRRILRDELHAEPRPFLVRRYEGRPPAGPPLPRDELVALSELTIHTVEWPGADPPILGIPGLAGSAHSLTGLGERLAPRHRFIALDPRGHGFSDQSPNGYDLARNVEDVRQLIEKLKLLRPVVLGFSLGGVTAAAVATTCAVRGLVLLEAAIGERGFLERRSKEALGPAVEALDARFASMEEYLERWRAERDHYGDEAERWVDRLARFELAPLMDGFRRRGLREALGAEVASVLAIDTLSLLRQIRCPVLIVQAALPFMHGEPWLPDSRAKAQLAACRAAELFVARASNHATLIRDPEPQLVRRIEAFVAAHCE
jgi:pimeloyl-ACP methyl ester carboxylesterase